MIKRRIPVITEYDKTLPYYLIDVGADWNQEHIIRPNGYLYQWIQCVKGEGELLVDGQAYRVKEGMGIVLLKHTPHEYYAISPTWIVDWIVFDGDQVGEFLSKYARIEKSSVLHVSRPDLFKLKNDSLLNIDQSNGTITSMQSSALIYSLLTEIVQYTSVHPNNSATSLNTKLKPLFQYIDLNYNKPLQLEFLAAISDMTPQHLCVVFKKATNLRLFQYINLVRIKKSKELLLYNPTMPIKEIASLSGFEDANYYCTVFKKIERISPGQFRKLY